MKIIPSCFERKKPSNKTANINIRCLQWRKDRDSNSRGTKPLGRRGSDSLLKAVIHYRSVRIPSIKNKKEHLVVFFLSWRKDRDSDSRGTKPLGRRGSNSLLKAVIHYRSVRIPSIKNKKEHLVVFFLSWRKDRDSDSRGTKPLGRRGSNSLLKAVIHYRSVRIPSIKNKKEHLAVFFLSWRKDRDSNPSWGISPNTISSRAP